MRFMLLLVALSLSVSAYADPTKAPTPKAPESKAAPATVAPPPPPPPAEEEPPPSDDDGEDYMDDEGSIPSDDE